jgi:Ca-activated chloride channel family protein
LGGALSAAQHPAAAAFALAAFLAFRFWSPSRACASEPPRTGPGGRPYEIDSLELKAEVKGQLAAAVLRTTFRNASDEQIEIDYIAPLPAGASVTSALLVEDGRELAGKVFARDEAFRMYSEAAAELKDTALIEYAGTDAFRARISDFPPRGTRTLELSISFLVPKERGVCALNVPFAGPATRGVIVNRQEASVLIEDAPGISNIYSPLDRVAVERRESGGNARFEAGFQETLDSFRLFWRTGSEGLGASLISHRPSPDRDGFFLFLAEPPLATGPPLPKDVCFVLDVSGSMHGEKINQAMGGLDFILDRLSPGDRFGLVHFNVLTGRWKEALVPMSPASRAEARSYVDGIGVGGGTDIETPLMMALDMMDPTRPGYVLFLTDGEANVGECSEAGLGGIVLNRNAAGARIFSFGVGYDVNARLLERFSSASGGSTVYVRPGDNIEGKVSEFFGRITSPVLTSPELKSSLPLNRRCPKRLPDLFGGGQIAVMGRYSAGGKSDFELSGLSGGEGKAFKYSFELSGAPAPDATFLGQLWATGRSAQIQEELDLSEFNGEAGEKLRRELTDELVSLARDYGVLTPFTSFLAMEDRDLNKAEDNAEAAAERLERLGQASGMEAVELRRSRSVNFSLMSPRLKPSPRSKPADVDFDFGDAFGFGDASAQGPFMSCASLAAPPPPLCQAEAAGTGTPDGASVGFVPPETIGGRAFFLKAGVLVQGDLTDDELKGAVEVERLSAEYFALASEIPADCLGWLSQVKPLVFRWKGKAYRIAPLTEDAEEGQGA